MSSSSDLKINLVSDASRFGPGVSSATSSLSRLASAGRKVALVAGTAMVVGAGLAARAAWDWASAAAADEEAQAKLANTLRNAAGATDEQVAAAERWITKMGAQLGIADDELRPALARLTAATGDVAKAQDLVRLAMDVSAGSGKSLQTVTEALVKAQNGSVSGLSRLGVKTKNAAGETLSLQQITGKLAKTFKGAATDAANTAGGAQRRLSVRMSELKETIGAKLLPVIVKLGNWLLDKALPAAQRFGNSLAKNLGPALSSVGEFIRDKVIPAGQKLYAWWVDKIAPGIEKAVTPIINGLRDAWAKVQEKLEDNRPELEKLWDAFKKVAEFIANKVSPVLGSVLGQALENAGTSIGAVIDTVSWLVDRFEDASNAVQTLIGWLDKIHVPDIDLPSIPGLGRVIAGDSSSRSSATGAGGSPFVVNITGALDPLGVARQVEQMAQRRARVLGLGFAA